MYTRISIYNIVIHVWGLGMGNHPLNNKIQILK